MKGGVVQPGGWFESGAAWLEVALADEADGGEKGLGEGLRDLQGRRRGAVGKEGECREGGDCKEEGVVGPGFF